MLFVIRFYQRRIAQTTAALTRLKPVWNDRSISPGSKARLLCCLVSSIFLYACQSWNLPVEMRKKNMSHKYEVLPQDTTHLIQRPCYKRDVRAKIQQAIGPHEDLLTIVKRRKLQWYCHVSRSSGLAKTILQGTEKGEKGKGRQKKRWENNIKE